MNGVRLIHFIWLQGRAHMAANYPMQEKWVQTWYKHFSDDWEFIFWDVDMIAALFRSFPNAAELQATFTKLPNKAFQADFARYVIVYAYGGMYVDTDMECRRKFDFLLHDADKEIYVSYNADLNPIELYFSGHVCNHWFYCPFAGFSGLWGLVESISTGVAAQPKLTTNISGPFAFGRMVRAHAAKTSHVSWHLVEGKTLVNCEDRYNFDDDAFPCAYAVHHLSGTWLTMSGAFRKVIVMAYGFTRKNGMAVVIASVVVISFLLGVIALLTAKLLPASGGKPSI